MLKIYNTRTRQKEVFIPIVDNQVSMYVCGVTVYDDCHLGHARSYVVWDMVRRYLLHRGYQVRYVQNFTDIDDKIIRRSTELGESWEVLTGFYINRFFEDRDRLNILPADHYPKVSDYIPSIIRFISELIDKGFAYVGWDGVCYSIKAFSEYGRLSGRTITDPLDFALWKFSKPGEPSWSSPWGNGRPGWHIECSAMICETLGEQIDIHCGGADLIFPHHENEIAQSTALTGKPLANYWLHNGFVKIDGEKMAKSSGNFTTIRKLLNRFDPMVIRLFILQAHYRKPIEFTEEALIGASNGWKSIQRTLQVSVDDQEPIDQSVVERFENAMDDDFNTPVALSIVFEVVKKRDSKTLRYLLEILGFKIMANEKQSLSPHEIYEQLKLRKAARDNKDWETSDQIRDYLLENGVKVEDQRDGSVTWVYY